MGVAALRLQILIDGNLPANLGDGGDLAVLGLEDREEAGLFHQPGKLDGVGGVRAPAERAGNEDVQVARPAELHRALDLRLEVAQLGDGGSGDVGDLVSHRDQRGVLALAEDVAGLVAHRLGVGGAGGRRGGARSLDAGVHIGLVVVTDEEHVVVSLEHPREAAEADVERAAVAALADDADVLAPLGPERRGDAGAERRSVAEEGVDPGHLPGALRVGGREDLEAARGVGRDQPALGGPHRGVEHVAGAERLAAALTGAVPGGERVGALHPRLHRALLGIEQPISDHVGARLVELDVLVGIVRLRGDRRRGRGACSRRGGPGDCLRSRASSRSTSSASRSRKLSGSSSSRPACSKRPRSDSRVIERPPSPAITVLQCAGCRRAPPDVGGDDAADATASAFSSTTTRRPRQSLADLLQGEGPEGPEPSAPILTPPSRSSSITSSIVPSTEPSATTIVSAPSVR